MPYPYTAFRSERAQVLLSGVLFAALLSGAVVTIAEPQTQSTSIPPAPFRVLLEFCRTHPSGMVQTSDGKQLTCSDWYKQGTPSAAPLPEQPSVMEQPSVIGSTYQITEKPFGLRTFYVHEEDGRLVVTIKQRAEWSNEKSKQVESSVAIEYENVNYVRADSDLLDPQGGKRHLHVEGTDGALIVVTLRTEDEAQELAEYVARKSPLWLELIGGAWRVRKRFACPEAGGLACKDFKELLDHDDPDITEYFYSRDENAHTYACFSDEENRFFMVQYSHLMSFGTFAYEEFENQQSGRQEVEEIHWIGDLGRITESRLEVKQGTKPQILGGTDSSSLSYQTKYTNRAGTRTQYSLSIRWATGRYTESFSAKGEKGKPLNFDRTGACVKLN